MIRLESTTSRGLVESWGVTQLWHYVRHYQFFVQFWLQNILSVMSLDHGQESCSGTHKTSLWWLTPHSWASLADSFTDAPVMVDVNSDIVDLDNDYDGMSRWNVDGNWLQVSSIYNLHLASRCYSKGKGDKSHRMRCTTTLKGGDTSPMWRRTSPTGEEFSTWGKRKEDVEGEGFSFSLCAAPLDRLSPHISEEQSCNGGGRWRYRCRRWVRGVT